MAEPSELTWAQVRREAAAEVGDVDARWLVEEAAPELDGTVTTRALAVGRANLAGIGRAGARVRLLESDWFAALPDELRGEVDVIVANPPYVAEGDEVESVVSEWEPTDALFAGSDGLDDIRHIVAEAPTWLRRPGALDVELSPPQADAVVALMTEAGFVE